MKKITNGTPAEAGNVWFVEPDPIELTNWEKISFYGAIGVGCIVSIAILAGAAGWVFQKFTGG